MKTLYDALGVTRDATARQIKDAYRRTVKIVHPDLNPGDPVSIERMKEVVRAYEVLGNAARRDEYDRVHAVRSRKAEEFNYGDFLRSQRNDQESQAKLVFYDLLHDNPDEALIVYNALLSTGDFELSRYLGREDFMDCAFLLAEEYESRRQYRRSFDLLAAIVRYERQKPYFRHFMAEVFDRLRTVVCFRMPEVYEPELVLDCLHQMVDWDLPRRDTAFCYKKAAELYLELGNRRRAQRYLQLGLSLDEKLAGTKKLLQQLGYVEPA